MRLATRTGLAAFTAAFVSLAVIGAVAQAVATRVLLERVDAQLRERAETAPILAAIAERLAVSELSGTLDGARVRTQGRTVELGLLPDASLPDPDEPGWVTVDADGQRWRLLTIEVHDVPQVGDSSLVQLAAPLGDTEAAGRRLRRRALVVGLATAAGAGLVGYGLGTLASRPLTLLRRDAARLDDSSPDRWRVGATYGSAEVDDVATALNHSLGRLAEETERRGTALESARAFASAASHELRAPLQSALTNLNLAASAQLAGPERELAVERATRSVREAADALAAVRNLAEAEFADPAWFVPAELADLVEAAVAAETGRRDVAVEVAVTDPPPLSPSPAHPAGPTPSGTDPNPAGTPTGLVRVWPAGVSLAVGNVVRNALIHGAPTDGTGARLVVTVDGPLVTVDDNGPGIRPGDRDRVLERFERGSRAPGTGLGLAIARQVVLGHGGAITLGDSPLGGTRVVLRFGPPSG